MNTRSNTVSASAESQVSAVAEIPAERLFYWSLRRELWESRSIYIAPLAAAGLFLLGFLISAYRLPAKMRDLSALDPMQKHQLIAQPYTYAALLIMFVTFVVAVIYCLDALHGERRDRSILFWKSLPVSDLIAVLAKASIPIVFLPLLTFVITAATHVFMLLLSALVLVGSGEGTAGLLNQAGLPQSWMMLLYHLLVVHGLWYAPIYGWLLLVSAWARRAPFLWAGLPLLVIPMFEKVAFNSAYLGNLLSQRINGGGPMRTDMPTGLDAMIASDNLLVRPGLWIGLAITAIFLIAAVRLRRSQGPI
jgi:ABC-2 type transport system permease protein